MSDDDVKRTLEQMFREGFQQGFQAGRMATSDMPPPVWIEWRGRTPVIHIERPRIRLLGRGN